MSGLNDKRNLSLGIGFCLMLVIGFLFYTQIKQQNNRAPASIETPDLALTTPDPNLKSELNSNPVETQKKVEPLPTPVPKTHKSPKIIWDKQVAAQRKPASVKTYLTPPERLERLKIFFNNWGNGGEWEYSLDANSFPSTISTPKLANILENPETELRFVQEFSYALGYSPSDIHMDQSTKQSGMYIQYNEGYEVYAGFVQLFYNFEDRTLFMMASHIQNIQNPKIEINVTKESLKQTLSAQYTNIKFEEEPEMFVYKDSSAELAWIVTVTDAQQKTYRLLFSTSSGNELERIPMFLKN